MFIRSVIGDMTLDMGPGEMICMAAGSCPGIVVAVKVALGVGERVGSGVSVGKPLESKTNAVSVADMFPASTVDAITVGRYSGG